MHILKLLTQKRKIGNFGENSAKRYLKRKGYKILKQNYVAAEHEIDIIAKNKDVIAFVEVKSRNTDKLNSIEPRPSSSVTPKKQRAIICTARHYLARQSKEIPVRFDIIEVYLESNGKKTKVREIKHLEGAFNFNTAYKSYK